jgi:adenine/guanine phosphoribosyltransferase-like PRPP-binding protein
MSDSPLTGDATAASNIELLERIGMLSRGEDVHRSSPLSDPQAFKELSSRLAEAVDEPYDLIVVRDLFGDRMLAYQLALITGKSVAVSYNREGVIVLDSGGSVEQGDRALIAADVHFTTQSIQAAASGVEQAGMGVAGAAILLRVTHGEYPFPVWTLEDRT